MNDEIGPDPQAGQCLAGLPILELRRWLETERGVVLENVKTGAGYIGLVTSSDAAVVTKIQAHAKRTMDEYQKMTEAHGEHGSHDHGS